MTPEAQRIAIAEACGWKPYDPITNDGWHLLMTPPEKPNEEGWLETIPDYLNDLNAMHEAEKVLTCTNNYVRELRLSTDRYTNDFILIHATAAQRAEAFLRTLGLWKNL